MLTCRVSGMVMIVAVLIIASTPILNYKAEGWATEIIKVNVQKGVWRCGQYCGSLFYYYTYNHTNTHFIYYHTGELQPEGHDNGHGESIYAEYTEVIADVSWLTNCFGDECNAT
jgi:hypothetical protein